MSTIHDVIIYLTKIKIQDIESIRSYQHPVSFMGKK